MKLTFKIMALSMVGFSFVFASSIIPKMLIVPALLPIPASAAALPIPTPAASAVRISSKIIQETTDQVTIEIDIPVITGLQDSTYESELNAEIELKATQAAEGLQEEAIQSEVASKAGGFEFRPYLLTITYQVKSDGGEVAGHIVSIEVDSYVYTGGAHGTKMVETYNVYDEAQTREVQLRDILGDEYKEIADQQINDLMAANPEHYVLDTFKGIEDEQDFYVEHNQAVIVFQEYAIAPHVMGTPEFRITAGSGGTSANTDMPIRIVVNGMELASGDASAYMAEDRTVLLPLRPIAEKLGYTLKWITQYNTVELSKGEQWTSLSVGKDQYVYNKIGAFPLGHAPIIKEDGNMYVPVSFFEKVLQASLISESGILTIKQ
ncbi:stalk domain-containing protein [Paenibacillus agricola]|uniref:DUF4163 domain-containing protein n=1 Tax=Paenibacillus agricola TaxID=2716264 RepID=A0ABX0J2M0_9BACL|nr:DUF4163 domain-containing protein [Paenibacillus agricola]NHN30218.1 DUF4163 domain-containing protein [Paenibacillus agricola]